jgi:hypothetical protein
MCGRLLLNIGWLLMLLQWQPAHDFPTSVSGLPPEGDKR